MKQFIRTFYLVAAFVAAASFLYAQSNSVDLKAPIPLNPNIKIGKLKNGITYFIMKNKHPEKRAELRLAVNAGAIEEDNDQRGLAHFTEHMAFNGTTHFKKNELENYLESSGVKFGADLNAYTSFDETVYMLQVPTDSQEVFKKGFLVLEDWARGQLFDSIEVNKERGVVGEEWRLGRGAEERMMQKYFPLLYKDSRYAERLPIGKKEIIDTCSVATLKRFYTDWYRPELMAVVAVGDFDVAQVEKLIQSHFNDIPASKNPRPLVEAPVPDHKETIIAKATDKEASYTTLHIEFKHPHREPHTLGDYREELIGELAIRILNSRFNELTLQTDPPFSFAYNYYSHIARTKDAFAVYASMKDKYVERSLITILTEMQRVKKFGFTASEAERTKREMLRGEEQSYNERDKQESSHHARECVEYFLLNEPRQISSIEFDYSFFKKELPTITLDEVNALANKYITNGENTVVVVTGPDKKEVTLPSDEMLLALIKQMPNIPVEPYKDVVIDKPLLGAMPASGKIVGEKKIDTLGITEWTLSNGAKVVLKPTDFKNDEILFSGFSWGGSSLYPDKDDVSASHAPSLLSECGIGDFDRVQLKKYMQGKIAQHSAWISETGEGIRGSTSPKDLETLFQLNFLAFTNPRKDSVGYSSFISRQQAWLENRDRKPENAFYDTVNVTLSQYHSRRRPYTMELFKEVDMERAYKIYRERFSNAGDFTFFMVGSFKADSVRPLVEKYIASLPSKSDKETWKDVGIRHPKGKINKTVKRGQEPKSRVQLCFNTDYEWNSKNNMIVTELAELLKIKLRENLREDKGGTYGVSVSASRQRIPVQICQLTVSFGCAPNRVDSLVTSTFDEINFAKSNTAVEADMDKVKELLKREHETNLQQNSFWLRAISDKYQFGDNVLELLDFNKRVDAVTATDIKDAANKYFDMNNYAKFILVPEN